MAKCDYCGSTIILGGRREANFRFCNDRCAQAGVLLSVASQVPDDVIDAQAKQIHRGACPRCGGEGPVDVQTSYRVWSALLVTSWRSVPQVSCGSCGTKAKLTGLLTSGLLGWWGFPWGVFVTPVQIVRNLAALPRAPHPHEPSQQLRKLVALDLAARLLEANQANEEAAPSTGEP